MLRLQRLVDDTHQLGQQRVQVGLVARGLGELGQDLLGIVLLAVEAAVDGVNVVTAAE